MKKLLLATLLVLLTAPLAFAQYSQDFEGLVGSPTGVILTGQDFFYLPAGSADFLVYTYAGNVLGVPQNPEGDVQFAAGTGPGGTVFARAQRDVEFGAGVGIWKMQYDVCCVYSGQPPSANNLGSFSIRYDDANVHNIHLFSWVDPNVPTTWQAFYLAYDVTGLQFAQPGESPGAAWESLELNHWYRFWTTVDLDLNTIVEVGVTDLVTMATNTFAPTDWYLVGGGGGAFGPPQNFRLFGGGSVAGNSTCWDNVEIQEAVVGSGACCFADGSCRVTTETECMAAGGTQFIVGGVCDPNPCPPVPTQNTTWGRVKDTFR